MTFSPPSADRVPNLSSDFKYKVLKTGTGVSIRKFLVPNATAVVIPNEIDGLPVVEIGPRAFENRDSLTSVSLPSQLATVGKIAFYGCSSLTKVDFFTIPKFGKETFYACEALTTVALPVDTETLRAAGFELSLNRPFYEIFDSCVVFSADGKTLYRYPPGRDEAEYVVPDGVETLGDYSFTDCPKLTTVALPASLTNVANFAFPLCSSLSRLTVSPDNPRFRAIDGIVISADGKTLYLYPPGRDEAEYVVPDGVEAIADYAFAHCYELTNIALPNSLRRIGAEAFGFCAEQKKIAIPDGLETVGPWAFLGRRALRTLRFGAALREIGPNAFEKCSSSLTLSAPEGSVVEQFAKENNRRFRPRRR